MTRTRPANIGTMLGTMRGGRSLVARLAGTDPEGGGISVSAARHHGTAGSCDGVRKALDGAAREGRDQEFGYIDTTEQALIRLACSAQPTVRSIVIPPGRCLWETLSQQMKIERRTGKIDRISLAPGTFKTNSTAETIG